MSTASRIEWTEYTWNPTRGCSVVSPGCTNCYAMKQAHRFSGPGGAYEGLTTLTRGGPVWTGEVRTVDELLEEPLRWRKPRRIFVDSMSDLFHEDVPDEFIERVFAVMACAPQHTFQLLTKRARRMWEFMNGQGDDDEARLELIRARAFMEGYTSEPDSIRWPLPNVWLGVSVERQKEADERIPLLLQTPAAVRWLSCEPLLGPVNLLQAWRDGLDWAVVGGEAGPGARPMHPDWPRSLRDQCAAAGVPFFFKQWGDWAARKPASSLRHVAHVWPDGRHCAFADLGIPGYQRRLGDGHITMARVGKKHAGRALDGRTHDEYPA